MDEQTKNKLQDYCDDIKTIAEYLEYPDTLDDEDIINIHVELKEIAYNLNELILLEERSKWNKVTK